MKRLIRGHPLKPIWNFVLQGMIFNYIKVTLSNVRNDANILKMTWDGKKLKKKSNKTSTWETMGTWKRNVIEKQ